MQQATYRTRRAGQRAEKDADLNPLSLIRLLIGELAALAGLGVTLIGGLLLAASYLL
ncbi:MAG: hypothetical protein ACXIUM_09310 [Wenzhouxiangella sp.]